MTSNSKEFICTAENLFLPADYLLHKIQEFPEKPRVILLDGEMGAGKTTFVSFFVKALNPAAHVHSPTFNLMNEYRARDWKIYHFDLYRIVNSLEIENLGFEEIWGKIGISFVEWWSRCPEYFDENSIPVNLQVIDEKTRRIRIG